MCYIVENIEQIELIATWYSISLFTVVEFVELSEYLWLLLSPDDIRYLLFFTTFFNVCIFKPMVLNDQKIMLSIILKLSPSRLHSGVFPSVVDTVTCLENK